eukprot:3727079-Karenia_brevis.AAC.1
MMLRAKFTASCNAVISAATELHWSEGSHFDTATSNYGRCQASCHALTTAAAAEHPFAPVAT